MTERQTSRQEEKVAGSANNKQVRSRLCFNDSLPRCLGNQRRLCALLSLLLLQNQRCANDLLAGDISSKSTLHSWLLSFWSLCSLTLPDLWCTLRHWNDSNGNGQKDSQDRWMATVKRHLCICHWSHTEHLSFTDWPFSAISSRRKHRRRKPETVKDPSLINCSYCFW